MLHILNDFNLHLWCYTCWMTSIFISGATPVEWLQSSSLVLHLLNDFNLHLWCYTCWMTSIFISSAAPTELLQSLFLLLHLLNDFSLHLWWCTYWMTLTFDFHRVSDCDLWREEKSGNSPVLCKATVHVEGKPKDTYLHMKVSQICNEFELSFEVWSILPYYNWSENKYSSFFIILV